MATSPSRDSRWGLSREFATQLGLFYINWAKTELLVDFAIGRFLKISPEQTHLITASIDFGRRAQWLREIIKSSDFFRKDRLLRALNPIQNESKRNAFAHSYLSSEGQHVTFVERVPHGKFSIKIHEFSAEQFKDHVNKIADYAIEFEEALGLSEKELNAFADAAINMAAKAMTSPEPSDRRDS